MKTIQKICMLLFLSLVVLIFIPCTTYAEDKIVECPDIKVIINGIPTTFDDVIISKGGRTLIPLRALLVSLGVKNDNEHIVWNSSDKSVTIYKDSTKIYLKQGSNKAFINDKPAALDTEPIGYAKNGRTYIPARFIAQALGNEVAWDQYAKRIYIRDSIEYLKVKNILDKAIGKMNSLKRYKIGYNTQSDFEFTEGDLTHSASSATIEIDKEDRISHNYSTEDDADIEVYCSSDTEYTYIHYKQTNPSRVEKWDTKAIDSNYFNATFAFYECPGIINARDVIYSSLLIDEDTINNKYIVKGDVFPINKYAFDNKTRVNDKFTSGSINITIDKSSYLISQISTKEEVNTSGDDWTISDSFTYSDFDSEFDIEIPKEALSSTTIDSGTDNTPIVLTANEKTVIRNLAGASDKAAIDGMYKDPYGLDSTEAMLFIILKNQTNLNTFNSLSDNAKKVFLNNYVQDNYGDYSGSDTVHAVVVYNGKRYAQAEAGYDSEPQELDLKLYPEGEATKVYYYDKVKNEFVDYY